MKLSVVMPVYNEIQTIQTIIERVQHIQIEKELIIVDDYSTDGTREYLQTLQAPNIRILFHPSNQGKGSALQTGFQHVSGDVVVIQDADLEYDPKDYVPMLEKVVKDNLKILF